MRYSNFAKIIDKNSEYYGQVFEVEYINLVDKRVALHIDEKQALWIPYELIQFCVTKDNEPVKIRGEYLSIGDLYDGDEIVDFVNKNGGTFIIVYNKGLAKHYAYFTSNLKYAVTILHPTNKIKITAEGKEYWISRDRLNELIK